MPPLAVCAGLFSQGLVAAVVGILVVALGPLLLLLLAWLALVYWLREPAVARFVVTKHVASGHQV